MKFAVLEKTHPALRSMSMSNPLAQPSHVYCCCISFLFTLLHVPTVYNMSLFNIFPTKYLPNISLLYQSPIITSSQFPPCELTHPHTLSNLQSTSLYTSFCNLNVWSLPPPHQSLTVFLNSLSLCLSWSCFSSNARHLF